MLSAEEAKKRSFGSNGDYTKYIRFARVTEVFDFVDPGHKDNYGKVSLMWTDTEEPVNGPVSYIKAGYSSKYGYGIVIVPSVGDIAACYTVAGAQPIILGFISLGQFESIRTDLDNTETYGPMPELKAGEILIKGKSQSSIILRNSGNVDISIKDGENITPVVNDDVKQTATKLLEKTSSDHDNTILDVSLGLSNELAGPGRTVLSCSTGTPVINTFEITGQNSVFSYVVGTFNGVEVVGLESVKIYTVGADNKRELRKVLDRNSGVRLSQTYYYNTGLPYEISEKTACTMDSNGVVTSITLPNDVSGILNNFNTIIQVNLFIRRPKFSCKVNEFGDLFINCRNAVINTKDNKSQFGMFENSRIVANAVSTELGNKQTGFIQTSRAGVDISAGSYKYAAINEFKPDEITHVTQDTLYFYITDDYPLIAYTPGDTVNPYKLVSVDEYKAMNQYDKERIVSKSFDYDANGTGDGFTRTKMKKLITDATSNGGGGLISYGELKTL